MIALFEILQDLLLTMSKMTVIKKRVDLREAAIKAKQQEQLRQALRSKRELAIQEQRKAAVKEKMLQRLQDKNAAEERKAKQRGDALRFWPCSSAYFSVILPS